jgi:hypothetical protein
MTAWHFYTVFSSYLFQGRDIVVGDGAEEKIRVTRQTLNPISWIFNHRFADFFLLCPVVSCEIC